ncbi:murein L,D-transpeptidase YcbB/YkuD [Roseibium hamelinense]|uniref:Murein L,D-transpeptidase YcbB/YkuD n=1 Tax=Roseibium hamelinense TaxID=150831 RepID=A0A562TH93_9HYPH|nr:L,D-transpeptidase family protein [Roseibium hamelinense]MTI42399.1 murein L,D-transpeptidase [Roseibium hamelinense]TWI92604.1 murein L,D-transpeptidase YcbB/YkuD [Roseibium hamelinense]
MVTFRKQPDFLQTVLGSFKECSRSALLAFAALSASVIAPGVALAESPLEALRNYNQRVEWEDNFQSTVESLQAMKSGAPTLSPETANHIAVAIDQYSRIVQMGGWGTVSTEGRPIRIGARDKRVVELRQRLMASGDLEQTAGMSNTFDSYVDAGLRRFQLRHGLIPDGVLGQGTIEALNIPAQVRLRQLETNLVRLRSMSGFLGDRYVMVNIPAAEIEAVENGQVRSRHTAVVGKIDRQTPILTSKIYELNFNPYWTVPVSIIRKDLIPKMKEDPQYLQKNDIRILDWNSGDELSWQQIDWNTDEATKYRFRQDPGKINSLGSVRINFHNKHQVYLHDTPSKSLFGSDYRFHSSGCVRVQNVRELVTWLLQSTTPDWNRARVDEVIRTGAREDVKLKSTIPLYMTYVTAWANSDGVVHFREDIYNRDDLYSAAPVDTQARL